MLSGPDLPGSKRLPGSYADSGPSWAGKRHWPAGAPFPAAVRLTSVPGPTGGAVPQAHVPLLTPVGLPVHPPAPNLQSDLSKPCTEVKLLEHPSQQEMQLQRSRARQPRCCQSDGGRTAKGRLTDSAWSRAWEKHFRSQLTAACSSSPFNTILIGFL